MYSKKGFYELTKAKTPLKLKKASKNTKILEDYINAENKGDTQNLPMLHDGKDISRNLVNSALLGEIKKCSDCKTQPLVTLQYFAKHAVKKQGVCSCHWEKLAESNLGWTSIIINSEPEISVHLQPKMEVNI